MMTLSTATCLQKFISVVSYDGIVTSLARKNGDLHYIHAEDIVLLCDTSLVN